MKGSKDLHLYFKTSWRTFNRYQDLYYYLCLYSATIFQNMQWARKISKNPTFVKLSSLKSNQWRSLFLKKLLLAWENRIKQIAQSLAHGRHSIQVTVTTPNGTSSCLFCGLLVLYPIVSFSFVDYT